MQRGLQGGFRRRDGRHRRAQQFDNRLNACFRVSIGRVRVAGIVGVGQHDELVLGVVEDHECVREHEGQIGHVQGGAGGGGQALDVAHNVIAQVAHRAAHKPGQAIHPHGVVLAQFGFNGVQGVFALGQRAGGGAAVMGAGDGVLLDSDHAARVHAQEGIAPDLLAAFHTFQQEGNIPRLGQFEIHGNGRFQVGQQRAVNGNQIALLE